MKNLWKQRKKNAKRLASSSSTSTAYKHEREVIANNSLLEYDDGAISGDDD